MSFSCLVKTLTLWGGKRMVLAEVLIDYGSKVDFVDYSFAKTNFLGFLKHKYLITCSSFANSMAEAGLITHFWLGLITMCGSSSQIFHSSINLN